MYVMRTDKGESVNLTVGRVVFPLFVCIDGEEMSHDGVELVNSCSGYRNRINVWGKRRGNRSYYGS